jgi:hypothetical protein
MRTWIAIISILAATAAAQAQTVEPYPSPGGIAAATVPRQDELKHNAWARPLGWDARAAFGRSMPTGQLGDETTAGWAASGSLHRFFTPSFGLGFKIDLSKFNGAETMPSDFSASQTRMTIDTVYNFSTFGDGRVQPYVSAGAGIARNTLNFGESSSSEWKPGVSVGTGVDVGFRHSDSVTMTQGAAFFFGGHAEYTNFGTFDSVGLFVDVRVKWGGQ